MPCSLLKNIVDIVKQTLMQFSSSAAKLFQLTVLCRLKEITTCFDGKKWAAYSRAGPSWSIFLQSGLVSSCYQTVEPGCAEQSAVRPATGHSLVFSGTRPLVPPQETAETVDSRVEAFCDDSGDILPPMCFWRTLKFWSCFTNCSFNITGNTEGLLVRNTMCTCIIHNP